jgi:hypothetical protein
MYTEKVRKQISKVTKNFFERDQLRGFYIRIVSLGFISTAWEIMVITYSWILRTIPIYNMFVLALLWINAHATSFVYIVADLCILVTLAFPDTPCVP